MSDSDNDSFDELLKEPPADCPFCEYTSPPEECIRHCLQHDYDFYNIQKILSLDVYGVIRLINYTREFKPTQLEVIQKSMIWQNNDRFLTPFVENDPLLYSFELEESEDIKDSDRIRLLQDTVRQMQNFIKSALLDPVIPPAADYYFDSYNYTEIHETMLKDSIRTEAYRDFVYNNKELFEGKVVLDVGCGTGILSMFCAKAGASKVLAVDNSLIIKNAQKIATANKLDHLITFIPGKVEEITLPVDSVDIIISEWMGYFLLFEGMLDSVLCARDKWLKVDGIMAPSKAVIDIVAYSDEDWYNDKCNFWNDVYGFNMSIMKETTYELAQVEIINPDCLISEPARILDIDLSTVNTEDLDFEAPFELTLSSTGKIHGLCGWFDCVFGRKGAELVTLSTSGQSTPTHWKQTIFVFREPIAAQKGDLLKGTFKCQKSKLNRRELAIEINATHVCGDSKNELFQKFVVK